MSARAPVRRSSEVVGALGLRGTAVALAVAALLGALVARLPVVAELVVAGLVLLILAVVVVVVHRRVLRPITELTDDTRRAADTGLPGALAALEAGADRDPEPAVPPLTTRGSAQVAALAAAVTSLQDTAVAVAAQQSARHRAASEVMVHLGRRNHGLVDRLVAQIAEVETGVRDPSALPALSRLVHTATRIRRHAESALMLTGAPPDRSRSRPAAMADVLRTALAGIEEHARVDVRDVEPVAITGSAVAELGHLVAELIENGTHFSPPGTRIDVTAVLAGDARNYRIRIVDRGVGMTAAQLDDANTRLRGTSGAPPTKLIGLDVVGRLAARHGITVVLAPGDADGVVATVTVPDRLLAPLSDLPASRRPVSALVAAAAFLPPRPVAAQPSVSPRRDPAAEQQRARSTEPDTAPGEPGAVATPTFVRPGVPRRVRGAQLPDLGPDGEEGPHVAPDAGRVQGRLDSLAAGLVAARTHNIPPLPRQLPASDRPADEPDPRAPGAAAAPPSDDG